MNQDLIQVVTYYATKPHKELSELLLNKSKDNLISGFTDLLTAYINDKNSSIKFLHLNTGSDRGIDDLNSVNSPWLATGFPLRKVWKPLVSKII